MEHANNPENQKSNVPHDLGQITQSDTSKLLEAIKKTQEATARNPRPWVVVENAGTDDESIRGDFGKYREAMRAIENWYYADELENMNVQLMRRNDDGTLTTEY
jgi:hypothetical protein